VVYLTLQDSQRLQFELDPPAARRELARGSRPSGTGIVNAVIARVLPGVSVEDVAETVARWKHLTALPQERQEALLLQSVVEKARRQIGLFTSILLVVSAVIIALILYTLTMDKVKEIATLKLIGAPDRTIVGLIVQQALAMGAIGWSTGAMLIVLVKDYFPRRVVLTPEDALMLGAAVLLICVVASALGVRLALKVDPATALGG
jgi:putative ABC transport system permease protein